MFIWKSDWLDLVFERNSLRRTNEEFGPTIERLSKERDNACRALASASAIISDSSKIIQNLKDCVAATPPVVSDTNAHALAIKKPTRKRK